MREYIHTWSTNSLVIKRMMFQVRMFSRTWKSGTPTGVGLKYYDFKADKNHFFVPTFAHIRYSILNRNVSPLIELKAGILGDFTDRGTGHFFRPAVGVKYKNTGIKVGYDWVNVNYDVAGLGKNSVTIGAFYKF